MPELPEVQTIISDLNKKIAGDTITGFWTDWAKTIKGLSAEDFEKQLKNKKILRARRIGKNIFIDLSGGPARNVSHSDAGGKTIYIHLKMTGHLLVKSQITNTKSQTKKDYFSDRVNQYIHHIWKLGKDKTLEFSDLRKFGKIMLVDTDKVGDLKEVKDLGMDVMDKELTFDKFQELLDKKPKMPIGILLMDQNIISGIGNIYRSEILFEAGVSPWRKNKDISLDEKRKIYQSIEKVLKRAIKMRGTSDSDYRDTSGAPGSFQKVLKVYNRESESCKKCGGKIRREKLGGRSAFFCENCQS